jgi:hypothetical protein
VGGLKTGLEKREFAPADREIDPAEFFNPEEFEDVWRRYDDHLRP